VRAVLPARPRGWAVHLDQGEQQFLSGEGETLALTMSAALAVTAG
jgi:hypothetical protein